MKTGISVFCSTCLHYLSTVGGERVPRTLGHTIHADRPNEMIHFDFLYMHGTETGDKKYIMIIKDDHPSFFMLQAIEDATAESAAWCLLQWFSLFGVSLMWLSDQGPHFNNILMAHLNEELHAHSHFTTPHCPQGSGTVEAICREVIRTSRALSEFRLQEDECLCILPLFQSILNSTTRPALRFRAPISFFCGLPSDNPTHGNNTSVTI